MKGAFKGPFLGADMTQVNALAVDMLAASVAIVPAAEKIIQVGSTKVKKESRATITAADLRGRLPGYPFSITYDVDVDATKGKVDGEIGPDKDKSQGPLGNVLEYGTSRSRPVPHLQPALEKEALVVQAQLSLAAGLVWTRRRP